MKNAFVSTAIYALGRQLGMAAALIEFQKQMAEPTPQSLPVIHTIRRLRELADIQLSVDCGATIIGQMRSRCFHAAYESGWDCWISLDDDVEASEQTCAHLLDAIDDPFHPRIVIVPYMMRMADSLNPRLCMTMPLVRVLRAVTRVYGAETHAAKLLAFPPGTGGGFGMVGMNRAAMKCIVETQSDCEPLRWVDGDGTEKLALFHDMLIDGLWYGEDTSFFRRVPPWVSVEALLSGNIAHAGIPLDLETL
jgi:hypothetical protein